MANQKLVYESPYTFNYIDNKSILFSAIGADGDNYYWTVELYAEDSSGNLTLVDTPFTKKVHAGGTRTEVTWDINYAKLAPYLKYGKYNFYFKSITYNYSNSSQVGYDMINVEISGFINKGDGIYVAPVVYDTNSKTIALTGNAGVLVRYMSKATMQLNPVFIVNNVDLTKNVRNYAMNDGRYAVDMNTVNPTNATFGDYPLTLDGVSAEVTTFGYQHIEDYNVSTSVPSTSLQKVTFTSKMVDYTKLTCSTIVQPIDQNGKTTLTIYGNVFSGNFGKKANALKTLKYYCYNNDYQSLTYSYDVSTIDLSGSFYRIMVEFTGLVPGGRYQFVATATDELMEVTSQVTTANSSYGNPIFDWDQYDFKFNVPVNISEGDLTIQNGNLTVNGDIDFHSTTGRYFPTNGTWTPTVNIDYLDSGTEVAEGSSWLFKGNYIRLGDMCLINFYLFFTPLANSSTTQRKLMIGGLPFEPDPDYHWQSGGGTASGYRIAATEDNNVFCGWSIEKYTKGDIFDPDSTGYYIFGKTAEVDSVAETLEASTEKRSYYLSGANYSTKNVLRASGTILYKVAED